MRKKLTKKSPCPCESGLRYEQCCRPKRLLVQKAKSILAEQEKARAEFARKYGRIRVPQLVHTADGAYALIGSEIYKQTRKGPYSFLNVVHDHALLFFGGDYLDAQDLLPEEEQHPAVQWMNLFVDLHNANPAKRVGAGAAWYRFAFDLFTIRDNARLTAELRRRLLDERSFQSARHELWVASLFVAAGFEINFEDEADASQKHPEFIAVHRETGTRIAVEAKSRHRRGVKGFRSGKVETSVGVRGLLLDAYRKLRDLPLYIFIDVNLPAPQDSCVYESWIGEIIDMMSSLAAEGYEDPSPANIVFFHNDPSHYLLGDEIGQDRDSLWILHFLAKSPELAHPSIDVLDLVSVAHDQRIAPPDKLPS